MDSVGGGRCTRGTSDVTTRDTAIRAGPCGTGRDVLTARWPLGHTGGIGDVDGGP